MKMKTSEFLIIFLMVTMIFSGCDDHEKDEREMHAGFEHGGPVTGVAFSSDGFTLATASMDDTLHLLNVEDFHKNFDMEHDYVGVPEELPASPMIGLGSGFESVAFAPDRPMIAAGNYTHGFGGMVQLWDTGEGSLIAELYGPRSPVSSLDFSTDGKTFVSGAGGELDFPDVDLWEVKRLEAASSFDGYLGGVYDVDVSPDGRMIAAALGNGLARVWDADLNEVLMDIVYESHRPYAVAFSPDSNSIATAGDDMETGIGGHTGIVRIWDIATRSLVASLDTGAGHIRTLAFSPDGTLLAAAGEDHIIHLLDPDFSEEVETLKGHAGVINEIEFSPNGQILASGSDDHYLRIWYVGDLAGVNCSDGVDNDGDGWTDDLDPDCGEGNREIGYSEYECNDEEDNDGDSLVDAEDPECEDGYDSESPDGGVPDGGGEDAGPDASADDGGADDSGAHDAGTHDSGSMDAGMKDAGPDSGAFDAGTD